MGSHSTSFRVTLMLCDWAEAVEGKLYVMGGGFTRVRAGTSIPMAIAALIHVPYDRTNSREQAVFSLLTEDGKPYPPEKPIRVSAEFEVGRPPGMRPGEESAVSLAVRFTNAEFEAGGYRAEARIREELLAVYPFTAREGLT